MVPGKFDKALLLNPGEYLSVNSELLSLTQNFSLSLWAKVLDDSFGVLARNGQFSLQYHDDNILRAYASTSAGWKDANGRLPSGRWVHYVLTYDGSNICLYFDGKIVSEVAHSGYLAWGDGGDHNLYLNKYANAGWESKAIYDDLRIYSRALSFSEVDLLWSSGAGDLGLSPLSQVLTHFLNRPPLTQFLSLKTTRQLQSRAFCKVKLNATEGSS